MKNLNELPKSPGRHHNPYKFAIKVDKALKAVPNSHWFNIQQAAIRGTPDRVGVVNGRFVALELKADAKSKRSKLQEYHIEKLQHAGAYARFTYPENWEEVLDEVKGLEGTTA